MKKKKVVCIVPIYTVLNEYEELSIKNLNSKLSSIPKVIICPKTCDVSFDKYTDETYQIIRLPNSFFKSTQTYNKLLRTSFFFKLFSEYEFILMHHPDSYIFSDQLEYWCNKDFDYIGAPLYKYDGSITPSEYIGIGNGGFSLHKVDSALKVLSTFKVVYPLVDLFSWWTNYNWNGRLRYLYYFLRMFLGIGRNSHNNLNQSRLNEDVFWGIYVPKSFTWYKVATFEEAYKFSMEYNCSKLLEYNNGVLPFGCHNWFKGNFLPFWEPYIILNE
jgi:hypothetical protein